MDILNVVLGFAVIAIAIILGQSKADENCRTQSLLSYLEAMKLLEEDFKCLMENYTSELQEVQQTLSMVKENTESILDEIKDCKAEQPKSELIFRVIAGTGGSAYDGYFYGNGTDSSNACKMKSVGCMYRSSAIDHWGSKNIQRVLYSIKKAGKEVAFVNFLAQGRDSTGWFSAGNVMNSSWSDLRGNTFNYFSIVGDTRYNRRFYINKSHGGCPRDFGWTVLRDSADPCDMGKHSSYPAILYANSQRAKLATDYDLADEMEIYIYHE